MSRSRASARLQREADLVIVEGAGSPAETNLRAHDIANMGFAHAADLPVVLVGDIDRGHVIASLVGAHAVLDEADRARIRASSSTSFAATCELFDDGLADHRAAPAGRDSAVVPWLHSASAAGRRCRCSSISPEPCNDMRGCASAAFESSCPDCHTSRTSTISIRCARSPCRADFIEPVNRCRSMRPHHPARQQGDARRSRVLRARKAGTSTCTPTCAAADACSASAPAIKCSAARARPAADRRAPGLHPRSRPARFTTTMTAQKTLRAVTGTTCNRRANQRSTKCISASPPAPACPP